ncbi:MAG: tetratricopeptide repeat protein, partial [Nitrospirae bacterium]|nr:tetratricopeptide repeat protein [Nitrospirota bacterium]
MLDKTAVTKIAQKHIEKGEIDKAIAELQKLLAEEHDPNIYNTIGDLYLRKKETENAIEVFKKAADIFREGGFYLKAIALYKKILNINPSDVPTLILSGELNAGRGLTGNASENFSTAVDILLKGGSTEKALDIYKKMIKVFPSNAALKIKAAELSVKIGYTEGAVKEYIEAATHYLDNGVTDKAQAFYHKAIELDPKNVAALLGLGRIAERQNNIEQALEYLKNALSIAPGNSNALLAYSSLAAKTGNTEEGRQCLI